MRNYFYQIFEVIGNNEDGEILDFDNPYNNMKFEDQYKAEQFIKENRLDGWKAIDIENF